jgi:hypothetical protein
MAMSLQFRTRMALSNWSSWEDITLGTESIRGQELIQFREKPQHTDAEILAKLRSHVGCYTPEAGAMFGDGVRKILSGDF